MNSIEKLVFNGKEIPFHQAQTQDDSFYETWDEYCPMKSCEMFGLLWANRNNVAEIWACQYAGYWFLEVLYFEIPDEGYKMSNQHFEEFLIYYCGVVDENDIVNWKEEGF
jgi:hypothetical protein